MANSMSLQKGGNTVLAESGMIIVEVQWNSTSVLDVSTFLVGANGKVPSDDYMVFYNQETEPERSVWLTMNEMNKVVFTIQLEQPFTNYSALLFYSNIRRKCYI